MDIFSVVRHCGAGASSLVCPVGELVEGQTRNQITLILACTRFLFIACTAAAHPPPVPAQCPFTRGGSSVVPAPLRPARDPAGCIGPPPGPRRSRSGSGGPLWNLRSPS